MVEPAPGNPGGDDTPSMPARSPFSPAHGAGGNGAHDEPPAGWGDRQPPRPFEPSVWPQPLAASAYEEDPNAGSPSLVMPPAPIYSDPLDDPANWGPPLPPPALPARSVGNVLWPWGLRGVLETFEVLALALIMFLFVRSLGQNFVVDGGSMEPTFHNGEMLIVNKLVYRSFDISWLPWSANKHWRPFGQPRDGDVIVFRFPQNPSRDFIKRVVGLPGQTVEVHGGQVFVDGKPIDERYIAQPPAYDYGPTKVPPNQYFVLGDNRNNSYDSHAWGMVDQVFLIGRAEIRYWPLDRAGRVDNETPQAASQLGAVLSP